MSNNAVISIVATECKHAADTVDGLEEKIKAACKVARDHWMATDENDQFSGMIAGVHLSCAEADKARIEVEMKSLRALNAALSGIPVAFEQVEAPAEPIGILALWKASAT